MAGCGAATFLAGIGQANAAAAIAPDATSSGEIVVTAQKRAETVKNVPASVTAVTTKALQTIGAAKLDDYVSQIPGLTVSNVSAAQASTQLTIRGITTGPGGNPTVGVYIDDSPFGGSTLFAGYTIPDLDPQDLARVEVLRGPQGTLYGAGSLGGLLKYVTAAPDPSHFFGRLEVDGSAVDGGGAGYAVRGSANIPINDELALRISGYDREDPGYVDNVLTGQNNVNDTQYYGGRASLGWQPSPDWKVRLSGLYQYQHGAGPLVDYNNTTFQPIYGQLKQSDAFGTNIDTQQLSAVNLEVEGRLGDFATLTSSTGYDVEHLSLGLDYTQIVQPIIDSYFGIPNVGVSLADNPINLNKFVQEVRLASPAENKLSWQLGGFYTYEHTTLMASTSTFNQLTGAPITGIPLLLAATGDYSFDEEAVFGDVTYHFTPIFDVTAGLRYSHDSQIALTTGAGLLNGGSTFANVKSGDSALTYLVNPRLKLDADTMVYARLATGYRPGGPNTGIGGTPLTYRPDTVTNYEVGLKKDFFSHEISVDVSAYWIDWNNIQVQEVNVFGAYIGNGAAAVSRGVDASITWHPVDGLQLYANGAYQDAYVTKAFPAGGAIAERGDPLPLTPLWSGAAGGDYQFPLFGGWTGQVGADEHYVGPTLGAFPNSGAARFHHPAYDIVDLRAGVSNDRWSLMFYAKNIGDDIGQSADVNLGPFTRVAVMRPRTFEASLSARF